VRGHQILLVLMLTVLALSPMRYSPPVEAKLPVKGDALQHPAKTVERLSVPAPTPVSVPVQIFRAVELPEEPPPRPTPKAVEPVPVPVRVRVAEKPRYDICRGKGRTYYNSGRSWHCNR
jgi:hypothetical protein